MNFIHFFDTLHTEQFPAAGGKGSRLARMFQAGYPVPQGFIVFSSAFDGERLSPSALPGIQQAALGLSGDKNALFAVRSSGGQEDSAEASFAGEFDSCLNVTISSLRTAVEKVWQSRRRVRAAGYWAAKGVPAGNSMAVVVQLMVPADQAGVLFTADPISGARNRMVGNYVPGLGDKLVSGETDGRAFVLERNKGHFQAQADHPLPKPLADHIASLYDLAHRLENWLGAPQDIEWALAGDQVYILQSRNITTLKEKDPVLESYNDSELGDYLWTNTNFGEALPGVMTPMTWSLMQVYFKVNNIGIEYGALPMGGNIGGRMYMNMSLAASFFSALGFSDKKMRALAAEAFGHIPEGIEIPRPDISRWKVLKMFIPNAFRRARLIGRLKKQVPEFILDTPARAAKLHLEVRQADTPGKLLALWQEKLAPELDHTLLMLAAGTSDYKNLSRKVRGRLTGMVGEGDTNALMSGISADDQLASLGPLLGLTQVARGDLSREDFLRSYGHRGQDEFELSLPTAGEDEQIYKTQLAEVMRNPLDANRLLENKRRQHEAAWARLKIRFPSRVSKIQDGLQHLFEASLSREAVRSEVVRIIRVFRAYALQAGMLTGIGEDIFYLTLSEIETCLAGSKAPLAYIKNRVEKLDAYRRLPPYPGIIRGHFDPFEWGAKGHHEDDPARIHAISRPGKHPPIKGFAGSPGIVEGQVRVLNKPDEGHVFQPGEILVANTTNIGWTLLFPRAAAIITNIGAPLSHAAIVARELGIPAVVGTGNATSRLKTGDRVRVIGGEGKVELLD